MSIFKLNNTIMNSAWGCEKSMTELFGYENSHNKPMAELWMGAHPKAPSLIQSEGETIALDAYIASKPDTVLGTSCAERFHNRLPYLFKVLSAKSPLSIQSHPNKQQAEDGWARENLLDIPLDAAHRNYKDDNHKPELVFSITEYHALNGFREFDVIISLFERIESDLIRPLLTEFKNQQQSAGLKQFYQSILTHPDKTKFVAEVLEGCAQQLNNELLSEEALNAYQLVISLNDYYPNDIGITSAFILNYIILAPNEAMYLKAGTPHAYLKGTGLELMANSDNVLRGGLTPKHIDVPELMSTTVFEATPLAELKLKPRLARNNQEHIYVTPAIDFQFSILEVTEAGGTIEVNSAEILFVVEGKLTLKGATENERESLLEKGDSYFVSAQCKQYVVQGNAKIARAITPSA
ncbi:mannose-6-phosphate isomerase, class I [Psychromonas sp. B3M02]|uniref:mannose-6-phosphate isomerase, class I n=1 Tax=Psychromonas sp. B3M02 TaxID=2267226 RepID=UPI000DE8C003|nr:mannose-6-phosphate isomerase, class I [Psychromonas sp. B3M02]RBW46965.1 mannose-6-phosphate isomerase, class I [Psychromonas sp. B3M02]